MSTSKVHVTEGVSYILNKVPEANHNNQLLILLYWKLFDNIDIPSEVIRDILEKGTSTETITRSSRTIKNLIKESVK